MTERQPIAVQVRKARDVVDHWPRWKQEAFERQINARRVSISNLEAPRESSGSQSEGAGKRTRTVEDGT